MDAKNYGGSVVETSTYLPIGHDVFTPEILKIAEEEIGETPEKKKESIKELRRFINAEKDFRPMLDDAFLIRFLRGRKYNAENALKALKNFYTFKLRYSRILCDIRPTELRHVFDQDIFTVLPYRHENGSVIGIGRVEKYDLDRASVDDLFAAIMVVAEYALRSEITQVCGVNVIIDMKGLSLRLVRHVASPRLLYRVVKALQDCIPVRIKAIHVVNEPFYFSVIFNIMKTFLSEKIKNRFQFHGSSLSKLHKQIPAVLLPKEVGGELGPMDPSAYIKPILELDAYYDKINKYGFQDKRAQFIRKKSSMAFGLFL